MVSSQLQKRKDGAPFALLWLLVLIELAFSTIVTTGRLRIEFE
jgi:hypothetical protein